MIAETRSFQAARDRSLRDELSADRGVQLALKKIEERSSGYGFMPRRQLLSGALRLTPGMSPRLWDAARSSAETLQMELPFEIFVRQEPVVQAYCLRSVAAPLVVVLSSRLVELFDDRELRFVIGHEFAHGIFDHFAIPMPAAARIEDVGGKLVSRSTQIKLYIWCRAAEISADRAGALCAGSLDAAASALLKCATGLGETHLKPDIDAFTRQIDELVSAPAACALERDQEAVLDCFDTHPYGPLRIRALLAFGRTALFAGAVGNGARGASLEDVEQIVEADLKIMEPTYLEDTSEESSMLRRLLYCAGICVAGANGSLDDSELRALRALLGAKAVPVPDSIDDVRGEFEALACALAGRPLRERAMVLQHATIIASADGLVSDEEEAELVRLAALLAVPRGVIDATLSGAAAPMD